jgi:hypothetical protein
MTMRTVDLRDEAAAEARRLARGRTLLRDGDERALAQLDGGPPWIAFARRAGVRRALGSRACLVWRVAFEDAAGRPLESRLVTVLVDVASDARRIRWDADPSVRARVEADCDGWREAVARNTSAFTSARLSRERQIAAQSAHTERAASQPGLFDRRAERARRDRAQAAAESEQAFAERLRAIADGASIAPQPARLLLVMAP